MPTYLTSTEEYFLLSSTAYADLFDKIGSELFCDEQHNHKEVETYEKLKTYGWILMHSVSDVKQRYRGHVFIHQTRQELCVAHHGSNLAMLKMQSIADAIDTIKVTLDSLKDNSLKEKFDNAEVPSDWTLSSTGYALGGWLAALFQYLVSDIKMGFYFNGRKAGRTFDAPGIGDFLKTLQASAIQNPMDISTMDYINYVIRPNLINTCGQQIATIACIQDDSNKGINAINDIINIDVYQSRKAIPLCQDSCRIQQ